LEGGAPRDQPGARREARGRGRFRAVREGMRVIASRAGFGPIPLRCGFGGFRGTSPASAGKLGEGDVFALCARGWRVIASRAGFGPIPLRRRAHGFRGIPEMDRKVFGKVL
jgi:hypothetical protein